MTKPKEILNLLQKKGVHIPCPESVEIGEDIDPARISGKGVTIHSGCRLYGAKTAILPGAELGYEAPVTVSNCQLGKKVKLNGGFFTDSCFLDGVQMGSGAQVREACLLEEGARGAHCVGLKHTILLPFVTLGSLINFCDCLMAGGTDEKNHSEVGSSYIHFNYTPNQDKATASLIGDVPNGVMMNQKPIFLGGQGGLVGPVKITYGVVVGAGNIVRKDLMTGDSILVSQRVLPMSLPFIPGLYSNFVRIVTQNTDYIANLIALRRWYGDVRTLFVSDILEEALLAGAMEKLDMAVAERVKRLGQVAEKMPRSMELQGRNGVNDSKEAANSNQRAFFEKWPEMEQVFSDSLKEEGDVVQKEAFLKTVENAIKKTGKDYINVIQGLTQEQASIGTLWLQGLVDQIKKDVMTKLPNIKPRGTFRKASS